MFTFWKKKPKEQRKLFYSTDVHCHLLPGVDHGAQSLDDALSLLEMQQRMGISRVVLTPHVTAHRFENTPLTIAPAFEILKNAVAENGLKIELRYSAEYRLDEFTMQTIKDNALLPLPGNYLLLENSFVQEYIGIDQLLFDLQLAGHKIMLAHPERYNYYVAQNRKRYDDLHNAGAKFQINLLSLAGYFGNTSRETALWLIEHDLVDFVGSDMHDDDHARAIMEYINSKEWQKLEQILAPRIWNDTKIIF